MVLPGEISHYGLLVGPWSLPNTVGWLLPLVIQVIPCSFRCPHALHHGGRCWYLACSAGIEPCSFTGTSVNSFAVWGQQMSGWQSFILWWMGCWSSGSGSALLHSSNPPTDTTGLWICLLLSIQNFWSHQLIAESMVTYEVNHTLSFWNTLSEGGGTSMIPKRRQTTTDCVPSMILSTMQTFMVCTNPDVPTNHHWMVIHSIFKGRKRGILKGWERFCKPQKTYDLQGKDDSD